MHAARASSRRIAVVEYPTPRTRHNQRHVALRTASLSVQQVDYLEWGGPDYRRCQRHGVVAPRRILLRPLLPTPATLEKEAPRQNQKTILLSQ